MAHGRARRGEETTSGAAAWSAIVALLAAVATACAQPLPESADWPVTGLRVKLGATAATVQRVYQLTQEPESVQSSVIPSQTMLRKPSEGTWFFFDVHKCLVNIRLEHGFEGTVGGMRIGETRQALMARLGQRLSHQPGPFPGLKAELSPTVTARFDLWDEKIRTIFLVPPGYGNSASYCNEISSVPHHQPSRSSPP